MRVGSESTLASSAPPPTFPDPRRRGAEAGSTLAATVSTGGRSSERRGTMRAVQFSEYGGPEVLHVAEVEEPHAGPGQIRVAVKAAGVNPIDWKMRSGALQEVMPVALPSIPGIDVGGGGGAGGGGGGGGGGGAAGR